MKWRARLGLDHVAFIFKVTDAANDAASRDHEEQHRALKRFSRRAIIKMASSLALFGK
jgi:hypothetical protein